MTHRSFGETLNVYLHNKTLATVDVDGDSMNQQFLTIAHKTIGNLQFSSTCPLYMSYIPSLEVPIMIMATVEVYRHT